ncbi:hypothetical protein BIU90_12885 [Curtobacterium sp. MCBA15_001]|nr:hypothetical protein BIU90_12885 [Curtobacterium sp. MCBA15_001]
MLTIERIPMFASSSNQRRITRVPQLGMMPRSKKNGASAIASSVRICNMRLVRLSSSGNEQTARAVMFIITACVI